MDRKLKLPIGIDNFEKINQLMSQAVEDDLKNVQEVPGGWNNMRAEATQVEQLKKAIFIAYISVIILSHFCL